MNGISSRCRSCSRKIRRSVWIERKYPPPVSPRMWPQPPAFSVRSPRRAVTDEPLPALTTIPSLCPKAAASPDSRSLPVMIRVCGQISAQSRESDCRSSAVLHPARKTPARSISLGSSRKIAFRRSGISKRKFEGGSFPCPITLKVASVRSTRHQAVFVPPPSTPRIRSPTFTIPILG